MLKTEKRIFFHVSGYIKKYCNTQKQKTNINYQTVRWVLQKVRKTKNEFELFE